MRPQTDFYKQVKGGCGVLLHSNGKSNLQGEFLQIAHERAGHRAETGTISKQLRELLKLGIYVNKSEAKLQRISIDCFKCRVYHAKTGNVKNLSYTASSGNSSNILTHITEYGLGTFVIDQLGPFKAFLTLDQEKPDLPDSVTIFTKAVKIVKKKTWIYIFLNVITRAMFFVPVYGLTSYHLQVAISKLNLRAGLPTSLLAGDKASTYLAFESHWPKANVENLRKTGIILHTSGGNHSYLGILERQIGLIKNSLKGMGQLAPLKTGELEFAEFELIMATVEKQMNSQPIFQIDGVTVSSDELYYGKFDSSEDILRLGLAAEFQKTEQKTPVQKALKTRTIKFENIRQRCWDSFFNKKLKKLFS